MDINQINYFLNLADTLNFTAAARQSGISQPSLTRSIQRLEEELGGPLIYRDGKDSRLTMLGRDVQAEFMRIASALENIREHSENSIQGRRRVLDIAVAATISPLAFSAFFEHVLTQLPSVELKIHVMRAGEDTDDLLSGRFHALVLPRPPADHPKLAVRRLFRERFLLAMAQAHPLATAKEVDPGEMHNWPYVDRLLCEFHTEITEHLMQRDILMQPRYLCEREDWVQHMVAGSRAICIMPERSALHTGLVLRPVTGLAISREVSLVTVSGSGTPVELRQLARLAGDHDWSMTDP